MLQVDVKQRITLQDIICDEVFQSSFLFVDSTISPFSLPLDETIVGEMALLLEIKLEDGKAMEHPLYQLLVVRKRAWKKLLDSLV